MNTKNESTKEPEVQDKPGSVAYRMRQRIEAYVRNKDAYDRYYQEMNAKLPKGKKKLWK
jgi:hypothetical protein